MTNTEFLARVREILKDRDMTLYGLQKKVNPNVLKESTFFSMFKRGSTVKIEYICEISKALDMGVGELVDGIDKKDALSPSQLTILKEFEGLDEERLNRILPIVRGVILAEKANH